MTRADGGTDYVNVYLNINDSTGNSAAGIKGRPDMPKSLPRSFYAMITPLVSDAYPDQGLPQPQPPTGETEPPYPDNSLPLFPFHPIVIPPDAIAPGVPTHPIYMPPYIDNSLPPFVSPPIYIPPDAIAPGVPTHPIYIPIYPDNTLPGDQPYPDQGLPGDQPVIDNTLPAPGDGGGGVPPITFPPLPEVPDDAAGLVLVRMVGQEAEWWIVTAAGEAQSLSGGKTSKKSSKSKK